MKPDLMTTEKLRLEVEKRWIEHVKLCQDNFLYFVKSGPKTNTPALMVFTNL